ncbi:DUF748 domain-containing protein [Scleromatobacter humisilvae]|uniref:DUF748 domain-containing protein n=1 Tax=Scleromatobacter humisilvae TaxID=2897159 RepID=A0A9X1YM47_9BURK|nr:DUF748 domain-containing protein [Scleromatobacter humisilvae]MCK9687253.1 DUF748 domain-containing protein [Scleromatobacter humisilvae]
MVQGKWIRRLATAIAAVIALWVLTWLAVPPLVKWQAPARLSAALGRDVTLGAVDFHPWALEIVLHDLAVGAASGEQGPPLLRVARVRANLAISSIFRRAPVIEAIDLDQARIALARTAPGHYDIDDLLKRFAAKPDAPPSEPARFALYNLQVRDLGLRFDDRPAGHVHVVDQFNLSLPFLSNLPANVDITVQPHLALRLNGAAFDSAAQATPFAATDRGTLKLALTDLDVRPYLGYLPDSLPVRVAGGALSADVSLAFAQPATGPATLSLTGWVSAKDLAVGNAAGQPLLAWKQARVGLADVQPLAHKLAFDSVSLQGVQWHLDRDANGAIDPLRAGVPSPSHAAAAASSASAPEAAPEVPWQVTVATFDIADSRIVWNDASTQPAAALVFDGLALNAKKLQWPATATMAFTLSANVAAPAASSASAAARLAFEGNANAQDAQVAMTLAGLPLQALAPYIAQSVVPRIDGRLAAKASLTWSGKADAPALKIAIADATLDALRVQPTGAASGASWDRLALDDLSLDVPARTVSIGAVKLVHPNAQVTRDARGQLDAAGWLRASTPGPAAPASQPAAAPWHVQVRSATLDDGLVQFTDASLHPEQHLPPLRAELRQLQLDVRDFAWFGDHPVPPAKVTLAARIGRPSLAASKAAHGGELGWKGTLGTSPLAARGDLRIVRFPVALVTPWVADKLPVSLLRAEAGYSGHVELQSAPAGLAVTTSGDALLGDVHLTTLAAASPASAASAPDELLGWQSLSLKGVKFAMKPNATPRLDVGQVELDDLFARVLVTEQGRLNLQDIGGGAAAPASAASGAASAPVAAASEPATAAPAPLPIVVNVGGIKLVNGRVDYTDHFVRPNYSAALTELNGSLGAFSSTSRDMAALQLHGRAEGTANLDISGQVNPLARPLALDIQAKATDLELAPLSPYAGKYAGYAIERGKLSMDVAYKIDADGKLEAKNQVILNQLTFGDAIASPTATKLPVKLAIALLKDRNGVIDINLPISGSVNDPQFSVGGIVVKLIVNLLVKALTSPFSLLTGGSSGGDGPDMSAIEFRPGTAVVTDASAASLDKVATALADRPALQLTITGSADPQAERADWQRESIEAQLRTMARDDALRTGAPASAPSSAPVALAPATRSALLKKLYQLTRLPDKPRNLVGMAKDLPDADMEALLEKNVAVNDEAMRQQALARAIAVRDALVARGISTDRVFLAAPSLHAAGADAWTPRASLALAMP